MLTPYHYLRRRRMARRGPPSTLVDWSPNSDLTYQRDSDAYELTADGIYVLRDPDVPRRGHRVTANDGVTYSGLLVEDGGTNLLEDSHDLMGPSWTNTHSVFSANPDGSVTVTAEASSSSRRPSVRKSVSEAVGDSTPMVVTFEVKQGTNRWVMVSLNGSTTSALQAAIWDFDSGEWASVGSSIQAAFSKNLADGWIELTIVYGSISDNEILQLPSLRIVDGPESQSYDAPDGTETVLVRRAQAEASPFPTSPILTTDAPASRAMAGARVPIDPNIPEEGFTLYMDVADLGTSIDSAADRRFIHIGDAANSQLRMTVFSGGGADGQVRVILGSTSGTASPGYSSFGERLKVVVQLTEQGAGQMLRLWGRRSGDPGWNLLSENSITVSDPAWSEGSYRIGSVSSSSEGGLMRTGHALHRRHLVVPGVHSPEQMEAWA